MKFEKFKDPFDLLRNMHRIKYAAWDNTKEEPIFSDDPRFSDPVYMNENMRVLFPYETWRKGIGTCWECALLQYVALRGYTSKTFYIDINWGKQDSSFHTHLGTTFELDNSFWWFEYSWYGYRGIHGPYHDIDTIYHTIKGLYRKSYKDGKIFLNPEVDVDSLLSLSIITSYDIMYAGRGEEV